MLIARRAVAAAVLMFLIIAPMARGQVLNQVPGDALVVMTVNDLQQTSGRIGELAKLLGIADMLPPAADPLAAVQLQTGMRDGINKAGDMAIAMFNPAVAGGRSDRAILLLLPVTDYAAFIKNFANAKKDGDLDVVNFPRDPSPTYVANWGQYAVLSPGKEMMAKKPGGLALPAVAARELGAKDIAVYANMPEVAKLAGDAMGDMRTELTREIDRNLGMDEANKKYVPLAKVGANHLVDLMEGFMSSTQGAVMGMTVSPKGIDWSMVCEFLPASELGKFAAEAKNTDATLVGGLPTDNYLVYGGVVYDGPAMLKAYDQLVGPMLPELQKLGDDAKPALAALDSMKQLQGSVKDASFGMVAPTGKLGEASLFQGAYVVHGDANALMKAYRDYMVNQDALMKMVPGNQQMKTTLKQAAKTVDGVALDEVVMQYNLNPTNPMEAQMAQFMGMLYGPNGLSALMGVVNDTTMVYVMGGNDALLKSTITAARAGGDNLGARANLKSTVANLPQKRIAVYYVSLETLINTAVRYAQEMGMGVPVQLPADLPPIGITAATERSAMRIDAHVPAVLMQKIGEAAMKLQQQMMGGPGGPGGPGM